MPKLKTQSSCKRRFRITGTGLLRYKNTGKRHGMTKRSRRQIRENRHPDMMNKSSSKFILKKFLSYFKKLRKRSGF